MEANAAKYINADPKTQLSSQQHTLCWHNVSDAIKHQFAKIPHKQLTGPEKEKFCIFQKSLTVTADRRGTEHSSSAFCVRVVHNVNKCRSSSGWTLHLTTSFPWHVGDFKVLFFYLNWGIIFWVLNTDVLCQIVTLKVHLSVQYKLHPHINIIISLNHRRMKSNLINVLSPVKQQCVFDIFMAV